MKTFSITRKIRGRRAVGGRPAGTPLLPFANGWVRYAHRIVAIIGLCGTALLVAAGYERQAGMALVMLGIYAMGSLWRTAATILSIVLLVFAPTIAGIALTVPVLSGLVAASATEFVVHRRVPPRGFAIAGFALAGWLFVVLLFSQAPEQGLDSRFSNTTVVALGVVLAILATRGLHALSLVRATLIITSVVGWIVTFTPAEEAYAGRHGGLGLNPNYVGLMISVGIVLAVGLALRHERKIAYLCAPGLLLGMAFSQSRGAVLAVAVGLVILLLTQSGLLQRSRARLITVASLVAAAGTFALFSVLRAGTWAEQSNEQRWGAISLAIELSFSHPLVGVGWQGFPQYSASDPTLQRLMNTHNDYLRVSAEGGLIAIVLFLIFLALAFRRPTTLIRRMLLGVCATWMTGLLFMNALGTPAVSLVPLLLLGILAGSQSSQPPAVANLLGKKPRVTPRRVVLCVGQLGRGGTERQVVLLAQGLVAQKIDVHVITLRSGALLNDVVNAGARSTVLNLYPEGFRFRGLPMLVSTWRLFRILRRERPDVVHGFLLHSYLLSSIVARLAGVPVNITGRRSLGELTGRGILFSTAVRVSNWGVDAVVANARAVADDTFRAERSARDKIVIIFNAVPALPARDQTPSSEERALILVNVANLKPVKGQTDLIRAAAILAEEGIRVEVHIVGAGPEALALTELGQKLSVDLSLVGASNDVPKILRNSDIYVHSSTAEGMSNAIMEAMAVALPVVATDVGGASELLDGCGVLVPPADPQAMAVALGRLARNPQGASDMGEAARVRALAEFSEAALVKKHLNLYGGLLEQKCAE